MLHALLSPHCLNDTVSQWVAGMHHVGRWNDFNCVLSRYFGAHYRLYAMITLFFICGIKSLALGSETCYIDVIFMPMGFFYNILIWKEEVDSVSQHIIFDGRSSQNINIFGESLVNIITAKK